MRNKSVWQSITGAASFNHKSQSSYKLIKKKLKQFCYFP